MPTTNMRLSRAHVQTFDPELLRERLDEINRRKYAELRDRLVVNDPEHFPREGKTLVPSKSKLQKP